MVKEFMRKLFKFEEQSQQEQRSLKIIHSKPIGSTGTSSFSGYPSEEYLDSLRGRLRADTFDRMRRSDSQVRMCLRAVKSPILAANFEVEPYDQNEQWAKEDAELCKFVLFEGMDKTWNCLLSEILTMIDFGHSVFERVDSVDFNNRKFGTMNGIKGLGFRSQRTIERWDLDSETGRLRSVAQYAFGDLQRLVDIPAEFLLVFSLDKEGSNYEGISGLRSIYGNWFRKDTFLKLNAIGVEKFAIPTPIVTVPNGKESGEQFENMIEAIELYMAHERGYLTKPEGWEIELNNATYDPAKVETSIDNEDKRMVKNFLANFLELGLNGFGSQSLSFDLSDFFLMSLDHVASNITETISQELFTHIINVNKGPRPGYPKLKHSGISDKSGKEIADIVTGMAEKKIITPDDILEAHMRKRFNLPEKSDQGVRIVNPAPANPMFSELMARRKAKARG